MPGCMRPPAQVLQDSLCGSSKVLLVCCLSPEPGSAGETLSSLNFAQRAAQVELGPAKRTAAGGEGAKAGGVPATPSARRQACVLRRSSMRHSEFLMMRVADWLQVRFPCAAGDALCGKLAGSRAAVGPRRQAALAPRAAVLALWCMTSRGDMLQDNSHF